MYKGAEVDRAWHFTYVTSFFQGEGKCQEVRIGECQAEEDRGRWRSREEEEPQLQPGELQLQSCRSLFQRTAPTRYQTLIDYRAFYDLRRICTGF